MGPGSAPTELLALREDLRLHRGGAGRFLIYDPLAHRYHEITADGFQMLECWRAGLPASALAEQVGRRIGRAVDPEEVVAFMRLLDRLGLLAAPLEGWASIHRQRQEERRSAFGWLLHNYLFIRIPLLRIDAFLQRTLPLVAVLFSRKALAASAAIGLVGLYLVLREWDAFARTFQHFFSLEGAFGYAAALGAIKILHELGHAYAARRFGCRVPTMGVAFMVLMPVLYTDVTDAWRLTSRRERMIVSAAGVLTELAIVGPALVGWAILPEGTLKSCCFFLATTSIVSSLVINLNPLMRFDGYYLLSDAVGVPNLQQRSLDLLRWAIREALFDLRRPCTEAWSPPFRAFVLAYAACLCLYRLALFIGIALLVYHTTFKLLGLLLFAVEIGWFVIRPIQGEVAAWWAMRRDIALRRRSLATLAAAALAAGLLALPLPHRFEVPAVIESAEAQRILSPASAEIVRIHVRPGDMVKPGDALFSLRSPKLDADRDKARMQLAYVRERYGRRAVDAIDRDASLVLEREIGRLEERIEGLERLRRDLEIRASVGGGVQDMLADLHEGRWIRRGEELASIVGGGSRIRGYVPEALRPLVPASGKGRFIADLWTAPAVDASVVIVAPASAETIDLAYLASTHGGTVAVNEDRERGATPVEAQYQIILAPDRTDAPIVRVQRGMVSFDGEPSSLAARSMRRMVSLLIRESGF